MLPPLAFFFFPPPSLRSGISTFFKKKMPPHAHGGGDDEEVVVVRTDGPPFVDLKATPAEGFERDFDKVCKFLGPGKVSCFFPRGVWPRVAERGTGTGTGG